MLTSTTSLPQTNHFYRLYTELFEITESVPTCPMLLYTKKKRETECISKFHIFLPEGSFQAPKKLVNLTNDLYGSFR